jgi:hypothetical protein
MPLPAAVPLIAGWIATAIAWFFKNKLGQWIVAAMAFIGIQFATNEFAVGPILDQIQASIGQTGGEAMGWIAFFNLDQYITCIMSAYAVAAGKRVVLARRA